MRAKLNRWSLPGLAVLAAFLLVPHLALASVNVLTVPWVPATPTIAHTTYPINPATEVTITLGATVPSAVGSSDSFMVNWHFGDGSADVSFALTNPYDISTTHQYPPSAAPGTAWTAVVTVTDTTNSTSGTANYYVTQSQNSLSARVNVAIDNGLWYMHKSMWRTDSPANGQTVNWGGWDAQGGAGSGSCPSLGGPYGGWDCWAYGSIDAENVQAFEVSGHLQNGPAGDPYTDDVFRGINRMLTFITSEATSPITYNYDPSKENYTCADGSVPQTTDLGACTGHGGRHYYNSAATSCTTPPCKITYDGNGNGAMIYSSDGSGEYSYTTSPFLDALVASGNATAVAPTGSAGVKGLSFKNLVTDMEDFYGYSQWGSDCDVDSGNTRGNGGSCAGGAWLYGPQQGDDDSTSQWGAIAFISGFRGFGLPTPASITDFNNVWVTNAQDVGDATIGDFCTDPTDPTCASTTSDNRGAYGYRGAFNNSNAWGPFAVTPSGMVQMAMDGVGRTKNTVFGDASTDFDQRWNTTESYYADNFCNNIGTTNNEAYYAPRRYLYGLYSFTKSMLLHDPSGSLTPIQYLRTMTPGVFSNPSDPPNSMDWYAGLSAANGGSDPCDGVAQTLVSMQQAPLQGSPDGHWFGNSYYPYQWYYETAWSIIMLQKTVFVACVNNLVGRGTPGSGGSAPRIDLTWSAQTSASGYNILRSSTNGTGYTLVGTSTGTAFSDRTAGLTNGGTFYYVVQPLNGTAEICQSNQATVKVPTR